MREERHIECVVEQAVERFYSTAIDVDGVAQRLEGEETDAHRQKYVESIEVQPAHVGNNLSEEVGVLKERQQPQIYGHRYSHKPAASALRRSRSHAPSHRKVGEGHHSQQHKVEAAALIVEIVREKGYEDEAQSVGSLQAAVDDIKCGKEEHKYPRGEHHRFVGIVEKQLPRRLKFTPYLGGIIDDNI